MTDKIVLVDFAGTLVKAEIIEEANVFRAQVLEKSLPKKKEHADPEKFYKINREFVKKLTGLNDNVTVKYRKNDLEFMKLSGGQVQNQISTNLFQIGMFMVAKKHQLEIFQPGLIEQLQRIKQLGYKLAIISGVRTDIISGMLQIVNCPVGFDFIYGQPPVLGIENQEQDVQELQKHGRIVFSLGDKLSDLQRGKLRGCKSIFVKWGHPEGGEEEIADFTITDAKELAEIIK